MQVSLKEIDRDNFDQVTDLQLPEHQQQFLASNSYSLAQSKFYPTNHPRAIYADEVLVGFLMYDKQEEEGRPDDYAIFRFMVDHRHQGKGIGRLAMQAMLDEIRRNDKVDCISICYKPGNAVAQVFYASFGFVETGLDEAEEMNAEIRPGK
ncbi:GNAT family N-acetyltransferase [Undibacterium sp.]|uniref:GNAT family N-acetyltransferase n=1 Tax=Undibacterium sp. TaxID=1914977 RepID=UPI00374D5A7A